jgi:hypothetical protein
VIHLLRGFRAVFRSGNRSRRLSSGFDFDFLPYFVGISMLVLFVITGFMTCMVVRWRCGEKTWLRSTSEAMGDMECWEVFCLGYVLRSSSMRILGYLSDDTDPVGSLQEFYLVLKYCFYALCIAALFRTVWRSFIRVS